MQCAGDRILPENRAGNGVVDHECAVLEPDKGVFGSLARNGAERRQHHRRIKTVHHNGKQDVLRVTLLRPGQLVGARKRVKCVVRHAVTDAVDLLRRCLCSAKQAELMQRECADLFAAFEHGEGASLGAAEKTFVFGENSVVLGLDLRLLAAFG